MYKIGPLGIKFTIVLTLMQIQYMIAIKKI